MEAQGVLGRLEQRVSAGMVALAAGALALGIVVYQLSLPNVLTGVLPADLGYDDGVYTGAAIRLVHGVLPYRDFVFVHPPGITYLLAPFAALGLFAGSHVTAIVDRCLTAGAVVANPILAGLLVRPLGRLATLVSSFALALWPLTVAADRGLELEPFVVCFSLLGAVILFSDRAPNRRRLVVSGLVLGFAILVSVWAVFPVAAALVLWAWRWNRGAKWFVGGLVGALAVPSLPFLVSAPRAYFHEVIVDQLGSKPSLAATSFVDRLLLFGGARGISTFSVSGTAALVIFSVAVLLVAVTFSYDLRHRRPLEWFALLAAVITFAGMLAVKTVFDHYAYFQAAMTAPLLGVCATRVQKLVSFRRSGRGRHAVGRGANREPSSPSWRLAAWLLPLLGLTAFLVQQDTAYAATYLTPASDVSSITRFIPKGACVLFDYPGELIAADRFSPSNPGCPEVVDPFGMFLDYDSDIPHVPPPRYPVDFEYLWLQYLQHADLVVLHTPFSDYIAWSSYTTLWFAQHFTLATTLRFSQSKVIYIYRRSA